MRTWIRILKKLHLYGLWKKGCYFLVNHVFTSLKKGSCNIRRCLLQWAGVRIGEGTTVVGPVQIWADVEIGNNCWINRGLTVHGNGSVKIGDQCDVAPDVTFLTGGHAIGTHERRAGEGEKYTILVRDGCWIGARATLCRNITIGAGSVVAACACVVQDVPENTVAAGVPAKVIRRLRDE